MNPSQQAYDAYTQGLMGPEQLEQYKNFLKEGRISLPEGVTELPDVQPGEVVPASFEQPIEEPAEDMPQEKPQGVDIPQEVWDMYESGEMEAEKMAQLESMVQEGRINIPKGGYVSQMFDFLTGSERKVPSTEKLRSWYRMPEMNSFDPRGLMTLISTATENPEEAVKTIQEMNPGVDVRQDIKGNYILKSRDTGEEFAIHPGFRDEDILHYGSMGLLYGIAAAGGPLASVLKTMGLQAGIEGVQAATGGEFNPEDILQAGELQMAIPGGKAVADKLVKASKAINNSAKEIGKDMISAIKKKMPEALKKAEKPIPELSETMREAVKKGRKKGMAAIEAIKEDIKPDPKTLASAERLGISEYLQPDHVTTNQQYRELAQAIKSQPGSNARTIEIENLEKIAKKADDIIDDLGGTRDLSTLDYDIKQNVKNIVKDFEQDATNLNDYINSQVPPKTSAPPNNVIAYIDDQIDQMKGIKNIDAEEKLINSRLRDDPSYALLDKTRKEIGAALNGKESPFIDADKGKLKKLYSLLSSDQEAVLGGIDESLVRDFKAMNWSVSARKSFEDDLKAIYGKQIDKSIISPLSTSIKKLSQGDVNNFIKLMKAVPEEMREEVTASGLATAFGVSAKNGQLSFSSYAKWYEGLMKNQKARNALFVNLPKESRQTLSDLYRVSKGISKASKEYITTGKVNLLQTQLQGTDNLIKDIYKSSRKTGLYVFFRTLLRKGGASGEVVSLGLANALSKGKTNALRAADTLIASPEFIHLMKNIGTDSQGRAIKLLARTPAMKNYMKTAGHKGNAEKWLINALQTKRQLDER